VSENPRLLAIEPGLSATITRDERDFFRPNWSSNAVVDGKYSIDVYLDCMQSACDAYAQRAASLLGIAKGELYDRVDHFLFHVPFPRMAEYAALRVFGDLWWANADLRARIGAELPAIAAGPNGDAKKWRKDFEKGLAKTARFREAFAQKVAPSLSLAKDVGNVYSGSLYLALVSLLEKARDVDLTGQRLLLGSYGSGASAKILSGIVADGYKRVASPLRLHEELRAQAEGGERVAIRLDDYERLHQLSDVELDVTAPVTEKIARGESLAADEVALLRKALAERAWRVRPRGESVLTPRGEFALRRLGTEATPQITDTGYRYYDWVE